MTHAEALEQVEFIIDAQLARAEEKLHQFEQRLRSDGVNEGDIAAVVLGQRLEWAEAKVEQLQEVSALLRSTLRGRMH